VANSDSHSLTDNTVGSPRNLVYGTSLTNFDEKAFNRALKNGKNIGTNGPLITARLSTGQGYGLPVVSPVNKAGSVHVTVTSAPWVPVQEVRFIVNGKVVKTMPTTV